MLQRILRRRDLPFRSPHPETTRHHQPIHRRKLLFPRRLRINPHNLHPHLVPRRRRLQRLRHTNIRILIPYVFRHQPHPHLPRVFLLPQPRKLLPPRHIRLPLVPHKIIQNLQHPRLQHVKRHIIHRINIGQIQHRLARNPRKRRDFFTNRPRRRPLRPTHHHIRNNPKPTQILQRILRRLRF